MKRWPLHKAHFWETAPFFRILLPFAAGILCYDQFYAAGRYLNYFVAVLIVLLILYAYLLSFKKGNNIYRGVLFAVLQALVFFCGISISYYSDVRNNKEWFGNVTSTGSSCLVRITDAPAEKEHSWKVPFLCCIP